MHWKKKYHYLVLNWGEYVAPRSISFLIVRLRTPHRRVRPPQKKKKNKKKSGCSQYDTKLHLMKISNNFGITTYTIKFSK